MSSSSLSLHDIQTSEARIGQAFPSATASPEQRFLNLLAGIQNFGDKVEHRTLDLFFMILELLHTDLTLRKLGLQNKKQLKEMAERCLKSLKILPITSQHGNLYTRLYQLIAHDQLLQGKPWEAYSLSMTASQLARDAPDDAGSDQHLAAIISLSLGHVNIAKKNLSNSFSQRTSW